MKLAKIIVNQPLGITCNKQSNVLSVLESVLLIYLFQLIAFFSMAIAPPMQPAKGGLTKPPHTLPEPTTRGSGFRWTLGMEKWLK